MFKCCRRYRRNCPSQVSWDIRKARAAQCCMSNSASESTSIEAESSGAKGTMWIRRERTRAELRSTSRTSWQRTNWGNHLRRVRSARLRAASNNPHAVGRPYYAFYASAKNRGLCPHLYYHAFFAWMFILKRHLGPNGIRRTSRWTGRSHTAADIASDPAQKADRIGVHFLMQVTNGEVHWIPLKIYVVKNLGNHSLFSLISAMIFI